MAEAMDISSDEGVDALDCSDPTVLNKYVLAGKIAQEVLLDVQAKVMNENARDVVQLCAHSDELITSKCMALFKKGDISRGVAFPTCISKNELAGHFSPLTSSDASQLQDGDLIKIDLGVQLDGFAALVATTFQVGGGPLEGPKANAVAAAWTGAECAIRMMKPGKSNDDITEMFQAVANQFGCQCLEGVLSHELRQFVIDGENTILAKPSPERQVETFELEPNKVYAIDVVMSTGEGKAIRKDDHDTTIYKRIVENQYQLKNKTARQFLKTVNSEYPTYPFTLRNFQESLTRARAGLKECLAHDLLSDYPVLHEKENEFIAQYKFTCVVRPNGNPLRLCGTESVDMGQINSSHQITDENILKLLQETWEAPKRKKRKKKKKKAQQMEDN
jgi:curved DNA binding protein